MNGLESLYRRAACFTTLIAIFLTGGPILMAQDPAGDEIYELSPFTVMPAPGYVAQSTLSASRLNTELRDVSQSISVLTEDFLDDIGALTPEDALLYSLNVENISEFTDPQGNGQANTGIAFNNFTGRVRGIDSAGIMRDFFNTNLQSDTYNLGGGVSISSGPNAVIFGLGGTGGVISTGYKRALLGRDAYGLSFRVDSEGSFRVVADLNQELIKDKLAVRIIGLNDNFETYRNKSDGDQERYFYSVTANPWKGGSLTAYYEDVDIHKNLPRNVVAYDGGITAYLEHVANGGDPYYDNSLTPGTIQPGWGNLVEIGGATQDFWYYADGNSLFAGLAGTRTVRTRDPNGLDPVPLNDFRWSIPVDNEFSNPEHYLHGAATNRRMTGDVYGAIFTQQLTKDLHIEIGYNKESGMTHYTSMAAGNSDIRVDINEYLPDLVTPNPYKGRYYVESNGQSSSDFNELESFRTTVSYDLDLTELNRWLGRHKIVALYTEDQIDRFWSWFRTRTVAPENVDSYVFDARDNRVNGGTLYRFYLDSAGEIPELSFEPFEGGPQADGSFVYARGNAPASGNTWSQLKKEKGMTGVIQSYWFNNRLITTLGYRYGDFQDGSATPLVYGRDIPSTSEIAWGWQNIEDVDRSLDSYGPEYEEDAINYGAVYHLTGSENKLGQISLIYNFADIFTSPTPNFFPDGTRVPSPTGESYDVGIMYQSPDGKFGGRLTYYNTKAKSLRTTDWRNTLQLPIGRLERQIGFPGALNDDSNSHAQRILNGTIWDGPGNDPNRSLVTVADINADPRLAFNTEGFPLNETNLGMTADRESEGYELELWANPTRNLTFRLTAAKNEAVDKNLLAGWGPWAEKRYDYWLAWAEWEQTHFIGNSNTPIGRSGNSVSRRFGQFSPGYVTLISQDEGTRVTQNVGVRMNFSGKYSFDEGALKGFEVGGSYRYREAPVIGYEGGPATDPFEGFPYRTNESNNFDFQAYDLDKTIFGVDTHDIDMFLSYRGKLGNGTRYIVRLNVRNVFNDQGIRPQKATTRGETVVYTYQAPRNISLTLDLDF